MDNSGTSASMASAGPQSMCSQLDALAGRTILVVDDYPALTSLVGDVFSAAGARVRSVNRSLEAMPWLVSGAFDILILDLTMPEVDGYQILRFLRERHPQALARTIVLTAMNPSDQRALAEIEQEHVAYLFKPFAIGQLLAIACRMLAADGRAAASGCANGPRH